MFVALISLAAQPLSEKPLDRPPAETAVITGFEKYGHATLDLTIEKILSDGYELGDTVDVVFSNGYKFENIPFYNGYYVKKG